MAIETPEWSESLDEMAALGDQIKFLTRLATQVNQQQCAVRLAELLETWRNISVRVTVLGKLENGGSTIAQQLAGPRLSVNPIETADYSTLATAAWEEARKSAAIVCAVPSTAPLFDDTQEVVAREFANLADKVFLAVVGPDEDAVMPEVQQAMGAVRVTTSVNLAAVLQPFLADNYLRPLIAALRAEVALLIPRVRTVVSAFAGFLALDPAEFGHRMDYVQRDVEALEGIGAQAGKTLQASNQGALAGVAEQITSISTAMRQQSDAVVQKAVIAHDVQTSQDLRTRFGKEVTANARAAGFREFDARVQAIAMNLNSSRSLLLSNMDQVREEAAAHLEELQENLGRELFASLLQPPMDTMGDRPFDVPLRPGENFAAAVTAAVQLVREQLPEAPFSSGWAARLENMFRTEMSTNVAGAWNVQTIDGPAAMQIASLWQDTVAGEGGLLVGRISTLTGMVRAGLASLRLNALRIPQDPAIRAKLAAIFSGHTQQLQDLVTTASPNATPST